MLLVRDSMSWEVVRITPDTTAVRALALCRERRIRHLPVTDGDSLVGVVSDRDLRSATPVLGDPERAAALERIRASEVMTREPVTAHPDDPIESAANAMRERWIGCLPVLEDDELVGIITSSDVMEALVYLVG
ncbi:MAG: CBS domain-containing protein, partial [Rubrobacter sp.]|nr:CBS domain-containing protein [Rubrobacter sp.]